MMDDGKFAPRRGPHHFRQPIIAILGDFSWRQLVERYACDAVAKNDAQHVKLAVPSELSGHNRAPIAFQQIGKRMRTEHAGVHGQLTTFNFSFLLSCP
jgi:hypothetical protein